MIPTLPGAIPGLLRLGSLGVTADLLGRLIQCAVVAVTETHAVISFKQVRDGYFANGAALVEWYTVERRLEDIVLDLSDPTGRVHAAWWLEAQGHDEMAHAAHLVAGGVIGLAQLMMNIGAGLDMSDEQIGALRAVVLRVAGLEVT